MVGKEFFIRKITSRKFWSLVAGLVTSFLVLFNVSENEIAQIVAVIGAFGSIVGYIFAEAYVDGKREESPFIIEKEVINDLAEYKEGED